MASNVTHLEHLLGVYKGLVEVSALINSIGDAQELWPAILEVARRVFEVEAASLFLVKEGGDLEVAAASGGAAHSGPVITVRRGQGIAGWVLEHRQPLLVPDAYEDPRFFRGADLQTGFRTRSILCIPLLHAGKEIGVLQVLNPLRRVAFVPDDLEAFIAYGNLAATAIERLHMIAREKDQQLLEQESAIAREIQKSFLPRSLPERPEISFAAMYRPAHHVGGDFYDVVEMGPDEFYFVIGDVSGKGTPAALLMAQALSTLRLLLHPGASPVTVLSRWNEMLCGQTIRGMFVTALLGRAVPSRCRVELASAGHGAPLRIQRVGTVCEETMLASPPLGILRELSGHSHQLVLHAGEWLVFFTDGLTESFNAADVALDQKGVAQLLGAKFASASEVVDALNRGELNHRQNALPHDDLTVLVLGLS